MCLLNALLFTSSIVVISNYYAPVLILLPQMNDPSMFPIIQFAMTPNIYYIGIFM